MTNNKKKAEEEAREIVTHIYGHCNHKSEYWKDEECEICENVEYIATKLEELYGEIERIKQHLEPTEEEWQYLVNAKTLKLESQLSKAKEEIEKLKSDIRSIGMEG